MCIPRLTGMEILSLQVSHDLIPTGRRPTQILVITDKNKLAARGENPAGLSGGCGWKIPFLC